MQLIKARMTRPRATKPLPTIGPMTFARRAGAWINRARPSLISLIAVIALAAPAAVCAQTTTKFDATRDAKADVAAAVMLARSEGKYVLVDVGGEWCIWCHILDGFFDDDTEARALRDRYYVVVKVNWSPQNHNAALLAQWPAIPGYPHLFVLDAQGKLVRSQPTGELERGRGYNRDKIIAFLHRYAPPPAAAQSRLLPFAGSGARAMPIA